jgi:agmatinase
MNSKTEKIASFNANGVGVANNQLFGLPFTYEESELVLFSAPWEVTVSYRAGAAKGPDAMLKASTQIDLYDNDNPNGWHNGIFTKKISSTIKKQNTELRKKAATYIKSLEKGKVVNAETLLEEINTASEKLNEYVYKEAKAILDDNKIPALVGGDHSTPLGLMKALGEKHGGFGILQIDAHADLRNAYEGFTYSHASIMFNALGNENIKKIVQVGVRDICDDEVTLINESERRVVTFYNHEIKNAMYNGIHWTAICRHIVEELPKNVYISFDIDGLDQRYCPNTGTPVPGGLEYEQAVYLLNEIITSGRTIIGFDLVEVAPGVDEWDAIVGARMLYKMCNLALKSKSNA